MAGKFKIFCDDSSPRSSFQTEDKPMTMSQHQPHQSQSQPLSHSQPLTTNLPVLQQTSKLAISNEQEKFLAINQQQVNGNNNNSSQNTKREPLGLRQTIPSQGPALVVEPSTTSSITTVNDEDQENDISMASLGSDFVPSITHDDDYDENSFEVEEEALVDDEEEMDDDLDADEELRLELAQAFKQHDDSQLFRSTVYIDDIETYLKQLERTTDARPLPGYMNFQDEIDSDKRSILINWLIEVSDEYDLQTETLFICTGIIDRFLSKMSIPTSNFQLLGVAAMFIASKYEEIYPPNLYQFVEVTDDTYSGKQICEMEQVILKTLNFKISLPTISFFLRQIFAFNKFAKKVYHLAEYLCHLSLLVDQPFLEYYPSEIALAAVILAAHQLDAAANISSELQNSYDKSNTDQLHRRNLPKGIKIRDLDRRVFIINEELPFCVESLRSLQERAFARSSEVPRYTATVQKYSSEKYSCVALLAPPQAKAIFSY